MDKEDLIGSLGAIGSTLAAFFGFLWNIGFVQLAFSFLAGSFSTYLVQHRLMTESEKRRIAREHRILMRDEIYGPLLQVLKLASKQVEHVEDSLLTSPGDYVLLNIEEVTEKYLYLLTDGKMRSQVSEISDGLAEYQRLLEQAKNAVTEVFKAKIRNFFPSQEITSTFATQMIFILKEHNAAIETINLQEAILKKTNPLKMFRKTMASLEKPTIQVSIDQLHSEDLKKVENVFVEMENLAWKEKRLLEYEAKRKQLLDALMKIVPELETKIVT